MLKRQRKILDLIKHNSNPSRVIKKKKKTAQELPTSLVMELMEAR